MGRRSVGGIFVVCYLGTHSWRTASGASAILFVSFGRLGIIIVGFGIHICFHVDAVQEGVRATELTSSLNKKYITALG